MFKCFRFNVHVFCTSVHEFRFRCSFSGEIRTKEEIFEAAMEKRYEYVTQLMSDWLAELEGVNAKEKLITLIKRNITDKELVLTNEKMVKIGHVSPHLILAHMKRNIAVGAPILAKIIRQGNEDGSLSSDYPDECAEVFLHLTNYWCDNVVFKCDIPTVRRRLCCLQLMMKRMGVDIVTDEIIEESMRITEKIYKDVQNG